MTGEHRRHGARSVVGELLRARGWGSLGGVLHLRPGASRMRTFPVARLRRLRSLRTATPQNRVLEVPEALIAEHSPWRSGRARDCFRIRKRTGVKSALPSRASQGPAAAPNRSRWERSASPSMGARAGCALSAFPVDATWSRRCRRTGRSTCFAAIWSNPDACAWRGSPRCCRKRPKAFLLESHHEPA